MNCIKCGMELPDGAKFCNFCGVKQELICGNCGTVLPPGSAFCHMCGNPVKGKTDPELSFDLDADLIDFSLDDLFEQEPAPKEAAVAEKAADPLPDPSPTVTAYPAKENFKKLFRTNGHKSSAYKDYRGIWKLEVELRFNDTYRDNTDPDYYCYGSFSIIEQKSGRAVPGLEGLTAYTLSDCGIYYVTQEGKICFLSSDGITRTLGSQENVIHLDYDEGVLTVTYVKNRRQTEYNEHRDLCGYMYEGWYDVYELDAGEVIFHHAPSGG